MKILIVDDSRTCRKLYRRELEKGDYQILEATDGVEALQIVNQEEIDLVLLDIEMPNMNGYEVCQRLKSKEFAARFDQNKERLLPVVFVTSNESHEGRVKGFNLGADDFITKGFKPGALLETVNAILRPVNPLNGLNALVVEDSQFIRGMVTRFLGEQGVSVIDAEDGIQAFDILKKSPDCVQMVITDLEMPGMNGDVLCRKIRRDLNLRGLPIIVLTASDNRRLLLNLFEEGATDYLVKPFEKEELLVRLKSASQVYKALDLEIKERQKAEEQVRRSREIAAVQVEAAGIAEMATSILHNIGNVINGVYVSCHQLAQSMKQSKLNQMLMAHQLIEEHMDDLADFLTADPKGRLLPAYLVKAGVRVQAEQTNAIRELEDLATKIDLMKDIISTQQSFAVAGTGTVITEKLNLEQIVLETLKVQADHIKKYGVSVRKVFAPMEDVMGQRVNLSHVLINLVKNAVEAMRESHERILTVRIGENEEGQAFITVADTGIGISEDHMEKLFTHGFTTKADGHGFGLSYCARVIEEMGGKLKAKSKGHQQGARFTIVFGEG